MGVNLHKDVTMTLQQTNQNHGFAENNSSVTNAPRPLARGRDCDIFALRLRECAPEPPRATPRILLPKATKTTIPHNPESHRRLANGRSESNSLRDSGRQLAHQPYNAPTSAKQRQHELSNHFGCSSTIPM